MTAKDEVLKVYPEAFARMNLVGDRVICIAHNHLNGWNQAKTNLSSFKATEGEAWEDALARIREKQDEV